MQQTRKQWRVPGMAIAVVEHDRVVWMGADGLANVETGMAATPETVWRIASLSKPISATAIMQLVASGRLSLDDDIWKILAWYPRKHNKLITLRHILTHTSGIRHYRQHEKENMHHFVNSKDATHIYSVDDSLLRFTPGTDYLYSTYAYSLLAAVIEKATSLTFADYLKENIFKPAGMHNARLDKYRDIIPKRAAHYRIDYYGKLVNAPYVDVSYKWAAGGVLASIEDVADFAIALDKGVLLSPQIQKQVYESYRLPDGNLTGYGLGWHVMHDQKGRLWVYHAGGATGGAAFLLRAPELGFAVAIACNLERPGDIKALAFRIADILLG